MFDPELYRDRAEVERWKARDPIGLFVAAQTAAGLLPADLLATVEASVASELADAVACAEAGTLETAADLGRDVYTERVAS
jgi:pyruvate dehydrogenase E1 component alpha subunit